MEKSSKKRGRPLLWALVVILTLAVLAAAAWFVAFRVNRFSLELALTGEPKIQLEYGDSFTEPGNDIMSKKYGQHGKLGVDGDAPAGNASLRPWGSLPILWARPVRFCGGGLFYITYAVPVEGPKGCGMFTRSP